MTNTNKWRFAQHDSPYYYYEKELYSLPDDGNTSVDMRLIFDADDHTCYYTLMLRNDDDHTRYYALMLRNDDGNTRDWQTTHCIPWDTGMAMLVADGVTFFQEASE